MTIQQRFHAQTVPAGPLFTNKTTRRAGGQFPLAQLAGTRGVFRHRCHSVRRHLVESGKKSRRRLDPKRAADASSQDESPTCYRHLTDITSTHISILYLIDTCTADILPTFRFQSVPDILPTFPRHDETPQMR